MFSQNLGFFFFPLKALCESFVQHDLNHFIRLDTLMSSSRTTEDSLDNRADHTTDCLIIVASFQKQAWLQNTLDHFYNTHVGEQ